MPWQVSDVEKYRKGLTPEQKKTWVKVANGALKDCLDKGGTDKTCALKAIRIANSKFGEDNMRKENIPSSAFSFTDTEAFASINSDGNVDIISYSGKVIKNHWYWGDLAIDVNGAEFPKKFYPILEQHDVMRKIGFSTKPLTENNELRIKNVTFVDTPASQEFQTVSKQGFPFEASIYGRPLIIEQLEEGVIAEVNGYKFKGPGSIWRKWTYKETSVCVFGSDTYSKAKAFTDEKEEVSFLNSSQEEEIIIEEVKKMVDIKKLKEDDPEGYNALVQEITQESKKKEDELFVKLTEVGKELAEKSKKLEENETKILALEKAEAIRQENEIRTKAESIWNSCLSDSQIPERLFSKVKAHVSYEKFLKEGGFDETAFTEAVKNEIIDWEKEGVSTSVLGKGFSQKDADNATRLNKEDDDWVADMRKMSGQTIN